MIKCNISRLILPLVLLSFLACQPDEDNLLEMNATEQEVENYLLDAEEMNISFNQRISDNITTCSPVSTEIPLITWPNIEVGIFRIDNNEDYLIADFEMDESVDWFLKSTQLFIVIKDIKERKGRSYVWYKKYVYTVRHEEGTKNFTYMVPLSDLKLNKEDVGNCLQVAGIARIDNGRYRCGKFAIAEDKNYSKHHFLKTWLHEYCLSDCLTPASLTGCATAWVDGMEYTYNTVQEGYYNVYLSEMTNLYPDLIAEDILTGKKVAVGDVEIFFWGSSSEYDLLIEFRPDDGYDIQNAQIYVGIIDPMRGPESFQYQVTFTDQNSLVFKTKTDFNPIYISIAATVCSEENVL